MVWSGSCHTRAGTGHGLNVMGHGFWVMGHGSRVMARMLKVMDEWLLARGTDACHTLCFPTFQCNLNQ